MIPEDSLEQGFRAGLDVCVCACMYGGRWSYSMRMKSQRVLQEEVQD